MGEGFMADVDADARSTLFADEELEEARRERIFGYDTERFPFHEHFRRMFQLEEAGADIVELSQLHKMSLREDRAPLSLALIHGFKVAGRKIPTRWNKALGRKKDRLKKFLASRAFKDFHETYLAFVQHVIVPLIGDKCGVVFQDPPTFRVQLPSASPIGKIHTDSDYDSHVDTEINIWVPVVDVWGPNTLHTESAPGMRVPVRVRTRVRVRGCVLICANACTCMHAICTKHIYTYI